MTSLKFSSPLPGYGPGNPRKYLSSQKILGTLRCLIHFAEDVIQANVSEYFRSMMLAYAALLLLPRLTMAFTQIPDREL